LLLGDPPFRINELFNSAISCRSLAVNLPCPKKKWEIRQKTNKDILVFMSKSSSKIRILTLFKGLIPMKTAVFIHVDL
jgi:hypothetical protein